MSVGVKRLVDYYQAVLEERFRGLPIVNTALQVEAVGFRGLAEHEFGVLITPWFINLVLLPGTGRWDDRPQGSVCTVELPGGKVDFTVSHDDAMGTTLSAAMFGTVAEFPDQATAREVINVLSQNAPTAESTVRTILGRLEKKGAVTHTVDDRTFIYRPLVQPENVRESATRAFIDRVFDGSASGLVSYVLRNERLSPHDIKRIRRQINEAADGTTTEGRGRKGK